MERSRHTKFGDPVRRKMAESSRTGNVRAEKFRDQIVVVVVCAVGVASVKPR